MIPSVSPEADRELTDGAVYYAREANADLGLAFIAEIERALGLLCTHSELGVLWHRNRGVETGAASRYASFLKRAFV